MKDTPHIKINTSEIPDASRTKLAVATMSLIRNILNQPESREMLMSKTNTSK